MRLKAKIVSLTYSDGSYIRISNYIKTIDKEYGFSLSKRITKVLNIGKWIKARKVIYSRRNYKSIKITEDNIEQK